jgi:hypothetical protein
MINTKHRIENIHVGIIDCNYTQHAITLTANPTGISFINVPAASEGNYTVSVYLQQDVVGNRNISWASNTNFLWPNVGYVANNPVYPILQTNPYRLDVFKFITFNGGQTWINNQPTNGYWNTGYTIGYNSYTGLWVAGGNSSTMAYSYNQFSRLT